MTFKNFVDTLGRKLQVKLSLPEKLRSINGFLAQQNMLLRIKQAKENFQFDLVTSFRRVRFDISGPVLFLRFGAGVSHFSLFEGLRLRKFCL
jgi:hypothetical protein